MILLLIVVVELIDGVYIGGDIVLILFYSFFVFVLGLLFLLLEGGEFELAFY